MSRFFKRGKIRFFTINNRSINPVYKHPFAAAKTVSALAYMYGRKTILNLITGASARDREFFDEEVSHEERYDRHGEYALLIKGLLSSKSVTRFDVPFLPYCRSSSLTHFTVGYLFGHNAQYRHRSRSQTRIGR
ncbi:LLM class flavin-dependent oxidoreductase [Brucella gallinifaecis]|uniref:LLM class flavin-dependent oxidoreductase n=1 Tax=Brucella gallinifaecis TaxID=215590 RepID=UPI00235E05C1|nr:LLM class flavin-dependent oxidoreductase [Brucella gallinifaecis]